MTSLLRKAAPKPLFWLSLFLIWFGILWILSSRSGDMKDLPEIPFLDKVIHFGYFFVGGNLLSAGLFTLRKNGIRWAVLFVWVLIVITGVGILDEYHQTSTPGRSGNDLFDLIADISGGLCGAFVFKLLSHRFRQLSIRSSRY